MFLRPPSARTRRALLLSAQTIARKLARPRAANTTACGAVERPKGPCTFKERGRRTLLLSARSSARKLPQSKAPVQGQKFFGWLLRGRSPASLQSLGSTAKTVFRPRGFLPANGVSQRKFRTADGQAWTRSGKPPALRRLDAAAPREFA